MKNLAQLIDGAAREVPDAVFGTFQENDRLAYVVERARSVAVALAEAGLRRGDVIAVIGHNSGSYLVTWMATQFAGLQAALINPAYPDELLSAMLDDLSPRATLWVGRDVVERQHIQIDMAAAWSGRITVLNAGHGEGGTGTGVDCTPEEISAFIHTSGTTGRPKFCALSHGYFLRLGRYFADTLALSRLDTVCTPLPLFHINPLGYGVVGSLTARAAMLSAEKLSPADFWRDIKAHGITALVMHVPPANLIRVKTDSKDAEGHKIRISFLCDPAFLRQFDIPVGVSCYGSTEAGGLCHLWTLRPDDDDLPTEGATNLAGRPRHDVEHKITPDGEILVRGRHPLTLFSGYFRDGQVVPQTDADGWFHTGDRGRLDEEGRLVFIERFGDSIRVNGEYVPIDFVERRLAETKSLGDFVLWRIDSPARGQEVVVYTTSPQADPQEVRNAVGDLPKYMHPVQLIRIERLPRDPGVGKVQRRLLDEQSPLELIKI